MTATTERMLKMSELAERSGVSAATIKHYLREGLLGSGDEVLRTSRNMAYYPEEFVERVRLIKRLQEERFMPLRVIRERVIADRASGHISKGKLREIYDVPANVLDRLEELGPDDVAIIERYREALQPLVEEEVRVLLAGKVDVERAAEPLGELIGAMHSKLLLAELRRQRG